MLVVKAVAEDGGLSEAVTAWQAYTCKPMLTDMLRSQGLRVEGDVDEPAKYGGTFRHLS